MSVSNDSLSLNLLVCWAKICKTVYVCFSFNKNLYAIDFHCDLPNDGKQKQVKATEVYLLWIFCKKNHQATGDQHRMENVKQIF